MFPSRILIAGCGYLGVRLGTECASRGAVVYGLRRRAHTPQSTPLPLEIVRVLADITRPETLKPLPDVDAVVLCQAPGKGDSYEKTYLEGTQNVLKALGGSPQVVLISSTSVYSTRDGSWVDETTDPRVPGHPAGEAGERAEVLLKTEEAVLNSGFAAKVVRSSGLYGPNRNRLKPILDGTFVPELSGEVINRVRVEDLVSAIVTVIERGAAGEKFLVSDECPTTQREFYEWLYTEINRPLLETGTSSMKRPATTASAGRRGGSKRCRNAKMKALGWKPQYPTYKEGYADLLASGG